MTVTELRKINEEPPEPMMATPMGLLQAAIASNMSPEQIAKFMDLQERHEANIARKAFAGAMLLAQREIPVVVRDKKNSHVGNKYASMEAVQLTIKSTYLRHGLTVSASEAECPRKDWMRVRSVVRHSDGHTEDFYRDGPIDNLGPKGNAVKTELHGSQSTFNYLSKCLLLSIFGVTVADEDNDGNHPEDFITQDQVAELHSLLTQTSSNIPAFLGWMGVDEIGTITQGKQFNAAMSAVRKKVKP